MKLTSLYPKPDLYYLIECRENGMRAVALRVKGSEVEYKKYWSTGNPHDAAGFFKALKPNPESKLIFLYDRSIAATFAGSVRLEKHDYQQPIREHDLDMFLTAAVKQFFNRFREEARRKLVVEDTNVVLANNRFMTLRLDGKEVVTPLGLTAKFAELEMEQTFFTRDFGNVLHDNLHEMKHLFHIELATALRDIAAGFYPDKKVLLAVMEDDRTPVYASGAKSRYFGAVSFPKLEERGELAFGSNMVLEAVSSRFGIGKEATRRLCRAYAEGSMSKHSERAIEKTLQPIAALFHAGVRKFSKKEEVVLIISDLPFMPKSHRADNIEYRLLTHEDMRERYRLDVRAPHEFPDEAFSPIFVAGLVAYLTRTGDNYLNMLARERMKWLVPDNSK